MTLVSADIRMVFRDPLLCLMPFVPFLAVGALRLFLPPVSMLLAKATGFELMEYAALVRVVVILFPGMFYGMIAGFLLLDDRDDGVSSYWSVTPVGRAGYLSVRLGLFSALAFVVGVAIGPVLGMGQLSPSVDIGVALLGAAQVAFVALLLAAFAANKVEGLSILKVLSGLDLAPVAIMLTLPVRAAAWPFPQYWAAEFALGLAIPPAPALAIGVITSGLWIGALMVKYRRRVD
jgi:hypothetical protein